MIINEKIKGERIYFRNLTDDDATEKYKSWLNDPIVNKYLETREATLESLKEYIADRNKQEDCLFFGIFTNDDVHIGNIKLEPITKTNAMFSIMIGDRNYWRQGLGTEATKLIVQYAFDQLKVDTVDLGVITNNAKAIRTYENVGFRVKEFKGKAVKHGEELFDEFLMDVNNEYFQKLK